MRIEIVNDEDIDIFINAYQFNGINLKDKETLLNFKLGPSSQKRA